MTTAFVAPAVPESCTSGESKPVTGSEKTTVKLIGAVRAGSAWPADWLMVTLGGVLSACNSTAPISEPSPPAAFVMLP